MEYINGIYQIIGNIDEDSCGKIFLVYNKLSDKLERLKLFNNKFFKENALGLFSENFFELSTINYPNIILINKFSKVNEIDGIKPNSPRYFYTYENFDSENSINYMDLNREESHIVMLEICRAIQYLHFRGIKYKYLNFENIIIYKNKKDGKISIKLRDLAYLLQYKFIAKYNNKDVNTFLSPKLIWEEKIENSADLYSLGVLFYYIYYKYDYFNVSMNLDSINSNEIHKMIDKLTTNNKENMYLEINDFINDFSRILRIKYDFYDKKYYEKIYFENKLIGRDKELNRVMEMAKSKMEFRSTEIGALIHGRSGVGKSRFIKELGHRLDFLGYNVFKYYKNLRIQEFGLFKEFIRNIAFNTNVDINLIKKYGNEIVKILPTVGEYWHIYNRNNVEAEYDKLRISNRIFKFIQEYIILNPTIFIIDNVNSLSTYDCEIIEYLINSEKEIPLFIIFGIDIEDENKKIQKIKYSGNKVKKIGLVNYSYVETGEYIKSVLGIGIEDIKFVSYIMNITHGNPNYIKETVEEFFYNKKIFVSEDRKWTFSDIGIESEFIINKTNKISLDNIDKLDNNSLKVLKFLAVYDMPIIEEIIFTSLDIEVYTIKEIIEDLLNKNILGSKFSDWGLSYFILDNSFRKELADKVSDEECKVYNLAIVKFLENKYENDHKYLDDRFIFYLEKGKEYEKCIFYCILYAEKLKKFNWKETQSLIYYEKAIKYAEILEKKYEIIDIIIKMGDIYFETDKISDAKVYYVKALNIVNETSYYKLKINILNKISRVDFKRLDYRDLEKNLKGTYKLAKENGYIEGEFTSAFILIEYYHEIKNNSKKEFLFEKYNKILANNKNHEYYYGKFLFLLGNHHYGNGRFDDASDCYYNSIEIFTRLGKQIETTCALNNIGVINLKHYGIYKNALDYFFSAEEINLKNNVFVNIPLINVNIADTYFRMEKIDKAINFYEKALEMASKIENRRDFFLVSIKMVKAYLFLGKFDKSYSILKKLEIEYLSNSNFAQFSEEYYILNIEYFLAIKNFEIAKKWYMQYLDNKNENYNNNYYRLFELFFNNQDLILNFKIEDSFLKELLNIYEDIIINDEVRLLRFVLHICINRVLTTNNFILLRKMMDCDKVLKNKFDNSFFRVLLEILDVIFTDDRKTKYKKIIKTFTEDIYDKYIWIAYKLLGDEFYKEDKYFEAMSYYFTSIDILKKITLKIPGEYKLNYIIFDNLKMQLKNRIFELYSRIVNGKVLESILVMDLEIESIENFFDVPNLNKLFENENFKKNMYESMYSEYFYKNKNIEDVIKKLNYSNEESIKNLLSYCIQICCADYGVINLCDEQNEINKKFEIGLSNSNYIEVVRKNVYYENEGIIINSMVESVYSYILKENQKALIYIPIFKSDKYSVGFSEDEDIFENEIGYMYIESSQVLNNFTVENFNKCKININLMKSFLDNYKLKVLSSIDRLTGVFLRKYAESRFSNELVRARNSGSSLSVVMGDIDKFKYVNDTYGHRKGDEILRKLGSIFNKMVDERGIVGRYGGEEFIFILPSTSIEDAYKIIENIRIKVEDEIKIEASKNITISFGISSYPEHGLSEEELVENADKALYYSKNTGRNKSTIWTKNISSNDYRFNKLAGILTGNSVTDATNIQSIVEIINMFKENISKEEKILKILSNIIDIIKAKNAYIVEIENGNIVETSFKERRISKVDKSFSPDMKIVEKYKCKLKGEYFINWDDFKEISTVDMMPNWKSIIVVPLIYNNENKGIVVAEVPITEKEFDFNNYNYVNLVSGLISAIL